VQVRAVLPERGPLRAGRRFVTLSATRWHAINESQYPWERDALEFVRQGLPDHDPYLAWANFEFVSQDGGINEVDLLVLSPNALFLVEIKSRCSFSASKRPRYRAPTTSASTSSRARLTLERWCRASARLPGPTQPLRSPKRLWKE
jgi:Nuclease-related domain